MLVTETVIEDTLASGTERQEQRMQLAVLISQRHDIDVVLHDGQSAAKTPDGGRSTDVRRKVLGETVTTNVIQCGYVVEDCGQTPVDPRSHFR
jgi:hypothetical protein